MALDGFGLWDSYDKIKPLINILDIYTIYIYTVYMYIYIYIQYIYIYCIYICIDI